MKKKLIKNKRIKKKLDQKICQTTNLYALIPNFFSQMKKNKLKKSNIKLEKKPKSFFPDSLFKTNKNKFAKLLF